MIFAQCIAYGLVEEEHPSLNTTSVVVSEEYIIAANALVRGGGRTGAESLTPAPPFGPNVPLSSVGCLRATRGFLTIIEWENPTLLSRDGVGIGEGLDGAGGRCLYRDQYTACLIRHPDLTEIVQS